MELCRGIHTPVDSSIEVTQEERKRIKQMVVEPRSTWGSEAGRAFPNLFKLHIILHGIKRYSDDFRKTSLKGGCSLERAGLKVQVVQSETGRAETGIFLPH